MRGVEDELTRVGVVLVAFRSAATIGAALEALPLQRLADVVVVDHGNGDGTADVVRAHGVRVVPQENLGFGAGCNRGERELAGAAARVLFLNPDAVLRVDDLERLDRYLRSTPGCGAVGPRVVVAGSPSFSAGGIATLATELRPLLPHPLSRLGPHRRLPPGEERTGPVGYVEGACFLVDRRALREAGGFDEGYFLYFEELELARRLARRGRTVHLCAEACVEHAVGVSRTGLVLGGEPHKVRSCVRYLRRWEGERAARAWVAAARTSWALRAATGRLPSEHRRALAAAARQALSHPAPPPAP